MSKTPGRPSTFRSLCGFVAPRLVIGFDRRLAKVIAAGTEKLHREAVTYTFEPEVIAWLRDTAEGRDAFEQALRDPGIAEEIVNAAYGDAHDELGRLMREVAAERAARATN